MIIEVPDDIPHIHIMRLAASNGCRIDYEKNGDLKLIPDPELATKRKQIRNERRQERERPKFTPLVTDVHDYAAAKW